jgi:hypothetical protein
MDRFAHAPGWKAPLGNDWFAYWDLCQICQYSKNYEEARVRGVQPE